MIHGSGRTTEAVEPSMALFWPSVGTVTVTVFGPAIAPGARMPTLKLRKVNAPSEPISPTVETVSSFLGRNKTVPPRSGCPLEKTTFP